MNGIHAASSRSDLEDRSSKVATSSKNKLDSTSPCSESEVTGGEAAAGSSSAAEAVQAKQSKDAKRKALSSSISGLVGREEKRSRREGEEGSHSRTENGKVASQERVRERDLAVASAEEDEDEDGLRTRNEKGASGTSAPLSPTSAKVRPKARDTVSASADSAPNSKGKTDKERDRIREGAAKKKKKVVATSGSAVGSNGSGKTSSRTGVVGSLPKETKNNRPTIQTSGMATAAFDAKAPQPLLSAKAKGKEVANDDIVELRGHSAEVFVSAWNPTVPGLLASGSGDATVRIWDLPKQKGESIDSPAVCKHLPPTHAKDISTLDWNPDGTLLASGSYDGIARLWTPQGDLHLVMSMHQGPIFGVRWNRKGTMLLTGSSDGTAIVWDLSSGKVRQQFSVHTDSVLDVDWLTSGKSDMMATSAMDATFATCSADNTVNICRLGHAQPLRSFKGHSDEVNAVRFDPSQTLLVSVSDDMTAKIWALDQTILGGSTGDAGSRKRTAFKSRGGSAADEYSSNMDVDRSEDEQEAADMAKMEGSKGKGCKFTLSGHTKELYAVAWCPTGPGSANPDQPRMLAT